MTHDLRTPEPVYIDETVTVYTGEAAATRLRAKVEVVDPQLGVAQVNRTRWEEAQRYERHTWMTKGQHAFTDRNEYHRKRFADYAPLHGWHFRRGIELGCGPFTNLRLLLERCRVDEVHLLDPLLMDYLSHPYCRYPGGRLGGLLRTRLWPARGLLRHPDEWGRALRGAYHVGGLMGRSVKLIPSTIEDYAIIDTFDLVVMINVLEHCRDATLVFEQVSRLLAPGGMLVYHDRMYSAQEVASMSSILYDAGHPLRVDQSLVDEFLARTCEPLMRAEYYSDREFAKLHWRESELYYIGVKQPAA